MAKPKHSGFVKFSRKIQDWGWYTDVKTFKLFFHLILGASFTDGCFLGVPIKRGQFPKSIEHLALETGLTCMEVRTAIKHLESTGEITSKGYPKFTVFTVTNYDLYQSKQQAFNEHLTSNQQEINKHLTINQQQYKNDKNNKNVKNERMSIVSLDRSPEKEKVVSSSECQLRRIGGVGKDVVLLSDEQVDDLLDRVSLDEFDKYVGIVAESELNGKHYKRKTHYQAILDMISNDRQIRT